MFGVVLGLHGLDSLNLTVFRADRLDKLIEFLMPESLKLACHIQ